MSQRTAEAIQLENELRTHDYAYWKLNKPLVNDPIYDQIVKRLLKIEPDNKYLKEIHTPKVESIGKVTHIIKMLSLGKAYTYNELILWAGKLARTPGEKFRLMPKLDGVSGQKKNGVLATRGDGEIGENITHKLSFINTVTKGDPEDMRGEILFTKTMFQDIKESITRKSGEQYKNERNAVGGILRRSDIAPLKILMFVDFEYIFTDYTFAEFKNLGENVWETLVEDAKNMNFPTDGLVLKVVDKEYGESLGATSHHLKSAIAFKFENPGAWSVLRSVLFSPGKHDTTPVGKIDPVEISGVQVKSPNLHNWKNILKLDLHIGDEVWCERAGDVIPDITKTRPGVDRTPIVIPPCSVCGSELIYVDPQLSCSNDECGGKLLNKLSDAVIRIGIDRLGKPTIKKMIDTFNIDSLMDIFRFTPSDLLKLDRFGETSASNLYEEIKRVKDEGVFEWQLLAALNIPGIGRSLSKDLLADRSLLNLSAMHITELEALPNIGKERGMAIIDGIFNNYKYLEDLGNLLPIKKEEVVEAPTGDIIKVCFTGKFPEKKSVYYDLLKDKGGYEIMDKVTSLTQVLVVADPSKESNKTKAAKKKGIKIVGIDELFGGVDIG